MAVAEYPFTVTELLVVYSVTKCVTDRMFGIAMLLVLDEAAEEMPEEGTQNGESA
jgi:hypothetical protein